MDRLEALDSFCGSETLKCCDLRSAAIATENFVIGDLKKLSKRIILEAAGRGGSIFGVGWWKGREIGGRAKKTHGWWCYPFSTYK